MKVCSYSYTFLFSFFVLVSGQCVLFSQTTNIGTSFNQASAATDNCGTTNVVIYGFQANVIGFSAPTFTAINGFTTSGTYLSTDILNLKLYRTAFSVFNTTNLVATITTGLGTGAHTFSGFSYSLPFSGGGTQTYFWITIDISSGAVNGRTVICDVILSPKLAITGTINYGTNTAGGTQTISCSALPVGLLYFNGKNEGNENVLEWCTATETNNDFFTVERSYNGEEFVPLGVIEGAGNSDHQLRYQYTDSSPLHGLNYYRLKQTDFNSQFSYSGLIAVDYEEENTLIIFPNPVSDRLRVEASPGSVAEIRNAQGVLMLMQKCDDISESLEFDTSTLAPGIYFVTVCAAQRRWKQQIVKL